MPKKVLVGLTAVWVTLTGILTCWNYMELNMLQLLKDVNIKTRTFDAVLENNNTWDVIVSSYMRSGSTFLGTNIGHREDAFYWYEPLLQNFDWKYYRKDGKLCDALTPTCGKSTAFAKEAVDSALQFLLDIYNCRLTSHGNRLNRWMHRSWFAGPSWGGYETCKKSGKTPRDCLLTLEHVCRNAKHRVTKVLRLDFFYISKLLAAHPRLKAILLLRDPRGILSSHIYAYWLPIEKNNTIALANDAKVLCSRMDRDIKSAKSLFSLYPDRVRIIQYEDFDDPVRKLKHLFSFLKMDADSLQLKSVPNPGRLSIKKSSDLFSYRAILDWETIKMFDLHCKNLYRELGLVQYKDEKHLRNISQSAIINILPYSLENP